MAVANRLTAVPIGETGAFIASHRWHWLRKRNRYRVYTEVKCYENVIYLRQSFQLVSARMRRRSFLEYGACAGLPVVGTRVSAAARASVAATMHRPGTVPRRDGESVGTDQRHQTDHTGQRQQRRQQDVDEFGNERSSH